MMIIILTLVSAFSAFLLVYLLTPYFIVKFAHLGLVARDLHKPNSPWVPSVGGFTILLGYTVAVPSVLFLFSAFLSSDSLAKISAAVLTILMAGLLGGVDDLKPLRQRYKAILLAVFSYPIVATCMGQSTAIVFPLIGSLEFGQIYCFILIPLAITTAANFTNMLAGFNGLEAGSDFIACISISIVAMIIGKPEVAIITLPMATALLAFLRYNWYPAKIFPGDSGTLMIGAAIASAAIIGKMEVIGMILLVPHAIDFTLKMMTKNPFAQRSIYGDTKILSDGTLRPPPFPALPHVFLRLSALNERRLVKSILALEAVYAITAILFTTLIY